MMNVEQATTLQRCISTAIVVAALVLVSPGRSLGADTFTYLFGSTNYTLNAIGQKTTITISLQETVTGSGTSVLGTTGLAGAGLRLNWSGIAPLPAAVVATSDIAAVSPLITFNTDLSKPQSAGVTGVALTNIVATGINHADGSVTYTTPVANFSFTASTAGHETISTAIFNPGNFTFSSTGATSIPLDSQIAYGNIATIDVVVPEPAGMGTVILLLFVFVQSREWQKRADPKRRNPGSGRLPACLHRFGRRPG
jgi:hypothetical protein